MKLTKLSLAAVIVAGLTTSSFAADTLADAFKNGKVKGELRAWYFDKDVENAPASSADLLSTGVILNYVTDKFNGFKMGVTMQSNFAPDADSDAKSVFAKDMYGSGAVLSEAYLEYSIGKTTAKVGRQFISTPLVNGSGSRMIKESFEGATIVNTDLPATTLMAGYVDKFQGRTSNTATSTIGDAPNFENKAIILGISGTTAYAFDNAYTMMAINKSIPNLTLSAQYVSISDVVRTNTKDIDVYYAEGKYVLPMNGFKLGFGLNFRGSNTDLVSGTGLTATSYDGTYTAGRIEIIDLAGFGASFSAATTSSDDYVIAGLGNGASSYTASLIRASTPTLRGNSDSYRLNLTYDFSKVGVTGVKGIAQYAWIDQDQVGTNTKTEDYRSYAAGLDYAVPALKGLTLSLQYETQEKESSTAGVVQTAIDTDELRFRANYKF